MTAEEFKYDATKSFVNDTQDLNDFQLEKYTAPAMTPAEYEEYCKQNQNTDTIPIRIFNFPWNENFEGLEVRIGKINIEEDKESGTASLRYEYTVLKNPNNVSIAEDHEQSRDNPDNELLDCFIGRVVESLLYRMSRDQEFLEKIGANVDE